MTSQFVEMRSSSNSFHVFFVSLVKFSYRYKFHINIITGSGVMIIFFYKGLKSRNPEIRNTPVLVLPNTWRLGRVRDIKLDADVSNEKLLNAANVRVTAFTSSELLRENQQGLKLPRSTQIRVNGILKTWLVVVFNVVVQIRENTNQKHSEYGLLFIEASADKFSTGYLF